MFPTHDYHSCSVGIRHHISVISHAVCLMGCCPKFYPQYMMKRINLVLTITSRYTYHHALNFCHRQPVSTGSFDGIVSPSNEFIVTSSITMSQVSSVVETWENEKFTYELTCYLIGIMTKIVMLRLFLTWVVLKVGFLESLLRLASS